MELFSVSLDDHGPARAGPFFWARRIMNTAAWARNTEEWLLAMSAPVPVATGRGAPAAPPGDCADLLDAFTLHRTAPIALRRMGSFPQLRESMEPALRAAQTRNVALAFASVADIANVGGALDAIDVPWCVLKGVPLAMRHYGDPAARRVGDIDLLVAPDAVHQADAALLGAGCRRAGSEQHAPLPAPRYWHEQQYITASGLGLELHHRLHPNPRFFPVATDDLLAEADRVSLGGVLVPVLAPVTELLYLCTHGSRHAWFRLLWICDIAAIATRAPAGFLDAAHAQAKRLGVLHPLAEGLLLAEALLGAPAIDWAHTLQGRSARLRYLLRHAQESLWSARDALGNPVGREHSSLLAALCQRVGPGFWAWELGLRVRHEWLHRRQVRA